MKKIRCKMVCTNVDLVARTANPDLGEASDDGNHYVAEIVKLSAVADVNETNKSWANYTPCGTLSKQIDNPGAQGFYVPGKEYYVDISEAVD